LILNLRVPHLSRFVTCGFFDFRSFVGYCESPFGGEGRTQSPALEKASRTGHPKFTILIQSGRTGVVQDPAVKTIPRNAEGWATRPSNRSRYSGRGQRPSRSVLERLALRQSPEVTSEVSVTKRDSWTSEQALSCAPVGVGDVLRASWTDANLELR
jgi:hypothetical protein